MCAYIYETKGRKVICVIERKQIKESVVGKFKDVGQHLHMDDHKQLQTLDPTGMSLSP